MLMLRLRLNLRLNLKLRLGLRLRLRLKLGLGLKMELYASCTKPPFATTIFHLYQDHLKPRLPISWAQLEALLFKNGRCI
ncbi:unnamed protein product [Bursaphelenchus okinawaensis]|uniref:Uncharacterized protein n=1 Tax=Bursaphelenchus okinawaensis TaxID=465554 RepID=A0A811K2B0_9BILA|nr:unnamed protein product [Bursaphelenchus okinawaensis]CAG9090605.1 unnamed protein product [Bursaphelenchus okinawaensis]